MKYVVPTGHLSPSSIGLLLKCPKQYEFRYVKGVVLPPGAALATGSVSHKVLETYYRDAINSSKRLTPKQTRDLSFTIMEEWLADNENSVTQAERKEMSALVPDLLEEYVACVGEKIIPLDVEKEHRYTTRCGVKLLMFFDLLRQLPDGETGIVDYKFTSKRWTYPQLVNSLQFNLYSIASGLGHVQVHNMVKGRRGNRLAGKEEAGVTDYASNLRVLSHVFDGDSAEHFENLVEAVAQEITLGVFPPCAPDAWVCTPDWCGWWHLCRGKKS